MEEVKDSAASSILRCLPILCVLLRESRISSWHAKLEAYMCCPQKGLFFYKMKTIIEILGDYKVNFLLFGLI
jgi:hypothetical protein